MIGHELSHAFDPNGMQFDADGKLTGSSAPWYRAMSGVVDQQAKREGVNPDLTSGENVADLAGLYVAHEALAASERNSPEASRALFTQWAATWATKMSDAEAKRRLLVDPHAPSQMRCNTPCRNIDAFHEAFGVVKGDGMYLDPKQRARMWW